VKQGEMPSLCRNGISSDFEESPNLDGNYCIVSSKTELSPCSGIFLFINTYMKKPDSKTLIVGVITLLLISASYLLYDNIENGQDQFQTAGTAEEELTESIEQESVIITVADTQGTVSDYEMEYTENTAYDMLTQLKYWDTTFDIEFQEFDFAGKTSYFITSINNYTPDPSTEFWAFLVNGEDSMVGVSDYIVQEGDRLHFEVEKIQM